MTPIQSKQLRPGAGSIGRGTLKDHLDASAAFARLTEQANRLRRLQVLLDAALPPHLLPGTHVANLKRGKVVIHAASGAVAVKLKQLAPRLAEQFIQQVGEVTGIEVRVQARRGKYFPVRHTQGKRLSNRSKQALTSLASGLGDESPLRLALLRLLRHA